MLLILMFTALRLPPLFAGADARRYLQREVFDTTFVVDGDASEIKVFDTDTYGLVGHVGLYIDADSQTYDPATKLMYVVSGGREAHTPYSYISVVDTTQSKKILDIKVDANWLEALALEKRGPRMFVNITSENAVGVMDRKRNSITAEWRIPADAQQNLPLFFDEPNHRLLLTTRKPPKLIVMDPDTGKVTTSVPCVGMVDDIAYDGKLSAFISQVTSLWRFSNRTMRTTTPR